MNDFRRYLSDSDLEKIERIQEVFSEVDRAADAFRALTGIRCPDFCGDCCTRSRVEATTIEMLPLALDMWQRNEADLWLDRISRSPENGACAFYKADPENPGMGRCGIYEARPLVCRLFGFFAARNKHGRYVYGGCRVIKQKDPEIYRKAVEMISSAEHLSVSTDYAVRIMGSDSGQGRAMMPVSKAASEAISKIGYRLDLFRIAG